MRLRALVCVLAMLAPFGGAGQAAAQAFGSISSLPPPPVPVEAAGTATPERAAPLPFSSGAPAAEPPAAPVTEAAPAGGPAPFSSTSGSADHSAPPAADPPGAGGASAPAAFSSVSSAGTGAGTSAPPQTGGQAPYVAERIVVEKSKRRLLLLHGDDVIATYPVRLGLNPYGHKQREGDFRTPEGTYYLSRRNPNSDFFLSVEVSYPNAEDRARARRAGVRPGGLIMIHGQPNTPRKSPEYYANNDWTDGCIAVSNSDMEDIWRRTRLGIPIEILP